MRGTASSSNLEGATSSLGGASHLIYFPSLPSSLFYTSTNRLPPLPPSPPQPHLRDDDGLHLSLTALIANSAHSPGAVLRLTGAGRSPSPAPTHLDSKVLAGERSATLVAVKQSSRCFEDGPRKLTRRKEKPNFLPFKPPYHQNSVWVMKIKTRRSMSSASGALAMKQRFL